MEHFKEVGIGPLGIGHLGAMAAALPTLAGEHETLLVMCRLNALGNFGSAKIPRIDIVL